MMRGPTLFHRRGFRAIGLLALAACKSDFEYHQELPNYPESDPPEVQPNTWTDRIVQVTMPQVDVLWVIDNSSSMGNEQQLLVQYFPVFADFFVDSGLDYHIGCISTDIDNPGQDGHLHGTVDYLYIDLDTPEPLDVFNEMAAMGTAGSGDEAGLGATFHALELRAADNQGFYREDASLHTIVISDEEDQTPEAIITADEFVSWYDTLKPEDEDRSFSSIVSFVDAPPADRGARYLAVTNAIGGIPWDITDEDWNEVLEKLGVQASGYKHEFFLSHRPIAATIEVLEETPEGITLTHPSDAWVYDTARNSILFTTYVPSPLSTIVISYTLASE